MEDFIRRVMAEPVMVAGMAICFTACMLAFRARVRRESRPDYKPPKRPSN